MYTPPFDSTGIGYLVIKASTARGALPLENASVNIRGAEQVSSGIYVSLVTDSSGLTQKTPLPAPPRALSESPGVILPYAVYDVDVFKEGYTDLHIKNVAVFDSITSVQPAIMVPLTDNEYTDSYDRGSDSSPDDRNR